MTALPTTVQAPADVHQVLARCRGSVRPALTEAFGRMHPWVGEMVTRTQEEFAPAAEVAR
ncbi:hypothetical protein AB0H97_28010 [Streptomyces sp. NPDC050788]|jgi:geranylgeranyl diphosphate synthase type I|uniref:hypothetical protein n=1 Tax=Streptomyces sp. NPDC050788 TaxID=3155041 RepID=UPI00343D8E70